MKYKKVKEAIFLSRPNRFIANVMVDGEKQTVHVKNTGRCRELLLDGARVFLEDHEDNRKNRKTRYSLVAVEKKDQTMESGIRLVNMDSYAPNRVVGEALADRTLLLPGLGTLIQIKPEVSFGASRFDFYAEDLEGNRAFIEVKGVTLEDCGIASFPDAPTERGIKHVKELCNAIDQGFFAFIIFVIQMKNVILFEPNDKTHPAFGEALREARDKGVIILAYDCMITSDSMTIGEPIPKKL